MKAVWIPKFGKSGVLEVREANDPSPGPGEVRIRVRASGINFADVMARQGLYQDAPPPPMVVGYEVSGVIDAVGEGVADRREQCKQQESDKYRKDRQQRADLFAPHVSIGQLHILMLFLFCFFLFFST